MRSIQTKLYFERNLFALDCSVHAEQPAEMASYTANDKVTIEPPGNLAKRDLISDGFIAYYDDGTTITVRMSKDGRVQYETNGKRFVEHRQPDGNIILRVEKNSLAGLVGQLIRSSGPDDND